MIKFIGKCLLIESKKKILVIGDLHFGYGESLRKMGIMIPDRLFENLTLELNFILDSFEIDEVVILGDLKHEFGKILNSEWREINEFIDILLKRKKDVVIIKGNHDKITGIITEKRGILIKDFYIYEDIAFIHGDKDFKEIYKRDIKTWLMGHAHPAVKISDGNKEEKFKCFLDGKYKGRRVIILPSFFDINEGTDPREFDLGLAWKFELNKFKVKVVGEGIEVLNFGKLKEITYF